LTEKSEFYIIDLLIQMLNYLTYIVYSTEVVNKMESGGNRQSFYNGKLISSSTNNVMNERRGAYGCMTEGSETV
jgi:hypothetical protein